MRDEVPIAMSQEEDLVHPRRDAALLCIVEFRDVQAITLS